MAQIITMPKLSDTMTVGTLVKWLVKEGDTVKFGDLIAEIETDKATMEFESFVDGTVLKLYAQAGKSVAIGAPLCAVGAEGESAPDAPDEAPSKDEDQAESKKPSKKATEEKTAPESPAEPEPADEKEEKPAKTARSAEAAPQPAKVAKPAAEEKKAPETSGRIRISPLARRLAEEKGIDVSRLQGTGPAGRIVRADILAAEKAGAAGRGSARADAAPSARAQGPIQEERLVPVSNMRATIARRLVESKTQIPHFFVEVEIDAGPLLSLRQQLNNGLEKEGIKLSVNDFILKACAEALRRVPAVNCSWEEGSIRHHGAAHVSFAVAIEDGLITPVVRDAQDKSLFAISSEAKTLGAAAKAKKLKPDQFTGGTFCVSNLGMMGVDRFSAIINPPNAAILAVGTTVKKPVVQDDQIVIGQRLSLTLSCDHRVVDGAVGATYLGALRQLLESPALLLL